jgi:hypothetical protein
LILGCALLAACRSEVGLRAPFSTLDAVDRAPRVLTDAAVVLFWLDAADTLSLDSSSDAIRRLRRSADGLHRLLAETDVLVLATHESRLYVGGAGHPRRQIMLTGLDYPWGIVLIDPGYPEQIITGPIDQDELEGLAWRFFGLDDPDAGRDGRRIAAAGVTWPEGDQAGGEVLLSPYWTLDRVGDLSRTDLHAK